MPRLNPLRHQLASTSPITLRGLGKAVTNSWLGADPRDELRALLCTEYAVSKAVLCGSGTEAVVLALETAERLLGKSTTVVLPAFSCFDVAAAAVRFGRPVRFYDVDPHTLGPDPDSLRAALEGDDRTVLVASLFGIPIDWHTLDPILSDAGAFVVEDAAQGHGALWEEAPLGGHGRLGVLSFGRGKGWTGGAGGALLIRDEQDGHEGAVPVLDPAPGRTGILLKAAAHRALGRPAVYGLPRAVPALGLGETRYRDVGDPRAMCPSAAVLALDSKRVADAWAEARRSAAAEWHALLSEIGVGTDIHVPEGSTPGYIRFPLLLPRGLESFSDPEAAVRAGAAATYPAPLPELAPIQPLIADDGRPDAYWAGAQRLVHRLVTLPTHPLVRASERDRVATLLSNR